MRYDYLPKRDFGPLHTATVAIIFRALSQLRELFFDLNIHYFRGNSGKHWRSYVQQVLAPILQIPTLKVIHIDNGTAGSRSTETISLVEEIGHSLPQERWRYEGLVIVGKEARDTGLGGKSGTRQRTGLRLKRRGNGLKTRSDTMFSERWRKKGRWRLG